MDADEIFEACSKGQVSRVQELLDAGVDPNYRDFDRNDTPLHFACAKGQKGIVEMLVEAGADVNAQNDRGDVPLHSLVKKRFDLLATWLIRQGADHNIENFEGFSPRDFALGFLQSELDEAAEGNMPEGALEAKLELQKVTDALEQEIAAGTPVPKVKPEEVKVAKPNARQQVMKIYFRAGGYKTLLVNPQDTARALAMAVAKKIGLPEEGPYFEVMTSTSKDERRLTPTENIIELYKRTHRGPDDKFYVLLKRGTPAHVVEKFKAATRF